MSNEKPWTPGPWRFKQGFINPIHEFQDSSGIWELVNLERAQANHRLAIAAPEMAELLIELAENVSELEWPVEYKEFIKLGYRAIELLKEIGYNISNE